ncbi:MAG: hypothetical protein HFI93_08380 [Lachnospiraceae bacterium]|nr:hypothetical protein [Lachnospiraceae bacterium]
MVVALYVDAGSACGKTTGNFERRIAMLSFLSNGNLFYVAAVLCLIGAVGKWLASQKYKQLMRQGENLGSAKDKQLRQMKGRFENAWRVNGEVPNVEIFVDRGLLEYRFLWTSLEKTDRIGRRMGVLLFLVGGVCAWFGYRAGMEAEVAARQFFTGAGMAALLFLWDMLLDTGEKRRALGTILKDYFENSLGLRLGFRRGEETEDGMEERLSEREENDLAYLKQSLDRIATSREDIAESDSSHRLTMEEEHLIKEILKEYLT